MPRLSVVLLLLLHSPLLFSQPPADSLADTAAARSIGGDLWNDVTIVGEEGLAFLLLPTRWSGVEWGLAGGVGVATLGIMASIDDPLRREVVRHPLSPTMHDVMLAGSDYGELLYANSFTGIVYLTGLITREDDIRVTGRLLAQSLLYSGAVTMGLRYLFGRSRPSGTEAEWEYNWWEPKNEVQSFPSGHTTVAFAVSSVLADRIDHPAATVILYSAAGLTAASRVALNRHWGSDVVVGAVIGTLSGLWVCRREDARAGGDEGSIGALQITPTPNGVMLLVRF